MIILNEEINKALNYGVSKANKGSRIIKEAFTRDFWKYKNNINWNDLCEYANTRTHNGKHTKVALGMLIYAIENDSLESNFKNKFKSDLSTLKIILEHFNNCTYSLIFNIDYEEVNYINTSKGIIVRLFPKIDNNFKDIYLAFLGDTINKIMKFNNEVDALIIKSANNLKIKDYKDINGNVFWKQINYLKENIDRDSQFFSDCLMKLRSFYRWLFKTYNEFNFFENDTNIIKELMINDSLTKFIKEDYLFIPYSNKIDLKDNPKTVFIIKNCDKHTTQASKNDYISINISKIESFDYRIIFNKYLLSRSYQSIITERSSFSCITDTLCFLEGIKRQDGYINNDLKFLNSNEVIMLKNHIRINKKTLSTINNAISSSRRFFKWCDDNGHLKYDNTFFDYMEQYPQSIHNKGKAIPDDELGMINNKFIEICKETPSYKVYYGLFLLLIETEFRISQLCNLKINSIQSSLKNDQYYISTNTKTSYGSVISQPICAKTKHILDVIIDETEGLRDEAQLESYKNHIFVYKNDAGFIVPVTSEKFGIILSDICNELNLRKYTATNLRDTHMTKSLEFIMKTGKSDLQLSLLTKHRKLDTTTSHYVEFELTKMLESIYQVSLDDKDINQNGKILDDIPTNIKTDDNLVENGCGYCGNKNCDMIGNLPCLVCKHFVTTIDHEIYFKRMITKIDELIKSSKIKHEVEDLTLIKTLYVNWLKRIYLKEEDNQC